MQARAHLKLIVSDAPHSQREQPDEVVQDRVSMVQPLSSGRLRLQWLRAHRVLALWSASAVLLSAAALVALGWL